MKKYIWFLLVFAVLAYSNETKISFIETRYVEALNEKVTKKGEIEFFQNGAKIYYAPPNERTIELNEEMITIKSKDSVVQKTAKEEPNIAIMFSLFRSIFENDEERIKKLFKIVSKNDKEVVLSALASSNPIATLSYELDGNSVKRFEFFGRDATRISIDVVKKR